jgi:hypothetical protein
MRKIIVIGDNTGTCQTCIVAAPLENLFWFPGNETSSQHSHNQAIAEGTTRRFSRLADASRRSVGADLSDIVRYCPQCLGAGD